MSDKFEFNNAEYIDCVDKIKLSDMQKDILKSKMKIANSALNETDESEKRLNTYYNIWSRAVAAVLALTIVGGVIYFLGNLGQKENSFIITASAAEIEIGDSEIKIASGEMGSGFNMNVFSDEGVEPYLNKMGKRDLFTDFKFTDFHISGKNIESVTFETNKNFTYFNIYTDNCNNEFTDMQTLSHSQYSTSEFEEYYDGFFGYVCDKFTFINRDNSDDISLDNKLAFMIESDWNDEEIAEWMDVVCDCFDRQTAYKAELYSETGGVGGGYISEEQEKIHEKAEQYMSKIDEKTIDGAEIDITVKFTDGTEQTKTLLLGYDDSGDESFLTAKTV